MKRTGISLIEILIVLAVLSILLAIGALSLQRYLWRAELQGAQQTVISVINKARSDSRKRSEDRVVTWTATGISSGRDAANLTTMSLSDSGRVRITSATDTFTYVAPYGRKDNTDSLVITLEGRNGLQASVKVIGVTGKAFTQ